MANALTKIKSFMKVLNKTSKSGINALNSAVKSVSNFRSWTEVLNTMINDCASYGGNGINFLKKMCGINLSNSDTGAITGSDAGGGSVKTAASIVPESGSWKYPSKTSFKIQGLTVTVPKKSSLNSSEQYVVGALYTWWIKNSLSLIKKSYGLSFTDKNASAKKINVSFYDRSDGTVAQTSFDGDSKETSYLNLRINMHYFDGIEKKRNSNGVGSEETLTYLDRTIAHELTHAVMAANINYFGYLPTLFKEGSAELVHGIDDKRKTNIQDLANDASKLRSALNGNSADTYAAGYIALRYLAKQASSNRKPSTSVSSNISSQIAENYSDNNFVLTENIFSDKIAADSLLQSNNFTENNSGLDEIIPIKNSSVSDFKTTLGSNFVSLNENISSAAFNSYSSKTNDKI